MLSGKTALITGSTSGIGLAIAEAFARKGANIVLNGFGDEQTVNGIVKRLTEITTGKVVYCPYDISQDKDRGALFQVIDADFEGIDILINNAGIQHVSAVEDFPSEKWEQIMALNLSAPFYLIKHFLPSMRYKNWGRIINIASTHGLVASAFKSAYVATKHGLIGLSKTIALETANSAITCNTICPGWVKTPLVMQQVELISKNEGLSLKEAEKKLLSEKHPSATFVMPEHIAEMSVFLCSEAGNEMRGSTITMDGGWVIL